MLTISNLKKSYDGKTNIIDDLNLVIETGDIYGFIGHNGAGKTTTIKAITGIHPFEGGSVVFDGISLSEQPLRYKSMLPTVPTFTNP